jgi:hypothetical protein
MQKLNYAQGFLCEGWIKIVIIMKFIYIIIMKNLGVFGKKAFYIFLGEFFFEFCFLLVGSIL